MTATGKHLPLRSSELKLIACASMLIDHIGVVLFPSVPILRIIGRIAMPIFCYNIAEGAFYTHNKKKYLGRLLLCALLTEIPFDLAFNRKIAEPGYQNVLFTLLIGLCCIFACDFFKQKISGGLWIVPSVAVCAIGGLLAEFLNTDYGCIGIAMIMTFYFFRKKPFLIAAALTLTCTVLYMLRQHSTGIPTEAFAVFALLPIFLHNGKKGFSGKAEKLFFYGFYPVHLLILALIGMAI